MHSYDLKVPANVLLVMLVTPPGLLGFKVSQRVKVKGGVTKVKVGATPAAPHRDVGGLATSAKSDDDG